MDKIQLFENQKIRSAWDAELKSNWGTICPLVEMLAADGKKRKIQAAKTLPWKVQKWQKKHVKTSNAEPENRLLAHSMQRHYRAEWITICSLKIMISEYE